MSDDDREFYCGCERHRIGTERPSWDEDGCCTGCGVDVDPWTVRAIQAESALASSRAEVDRLTREREQDRDAFLADVQKRATDYESEVARERARADAAEAGEHEAVVAYNEEKARADAAEREREEATRRAKMAEADVAALPTVLAAAAADAERVREALRGLVEAVDKRRESPFCTICGMPVYRVTPGAAVPHTKDCLIAAARRALEDKP